jgi:acyl-CoA reductase-like NAD-dependent aldehyde dehydrogenase
MGAMQPLLPQPGVSPREEYRHFIDGRWRASRGAETIDVENPSTGRVFTRCARGREADVDAAVESAIHGFNAWRALQPAERGRILNRIAELVRARSESFARLETMDTGKPLSVSRADVETCARYFEYYAGAADKMLGEVIPAGNAHLVYSVREPYGVTGHIVPWNVPLSMAARGAAPALCAGNSVVLKPAEETPITTLELAAVGAEAGLPPGALNVVTGYGDEAGSALVRHRDVRKIAFTGSVDVGRLVLRCAADRIVPATVELGGKSPFIVFDDASLKRAAQVARRAFVYNTGQICSAGTRLLVHRSVQHTFADRLIEELREVRVGDGMSDPTVGPLISAKQLSRVNAYLDIGREEGAILAFGGGRPAGLGESGYFVEPTLFTNASRRSSAPSRFSFRSTTTRRRSRSPTTATTGSPRRCGRATWAAPTGSPTRWRPGRSTSTTTCRSASKRPSAGTRTVATAARRDWPPWTTTRKSRRSWSIGRRVTEGGGVVVIVAPRRMPANPGTLAEPGFFTPFAGTRRSLQ